MTDFRISPAQALQVMAVSVMLKDGELQLSGDESEKAEAALIDVGQEIALQIGNLESE